MTTAQWVFDKAIFLMDEQNESTGQTVNTDTKEYQLRAIGIMNVLRHELYVISSTYSNADAVGRPVCPEIQAYTDEIALDDAVAQGVMPYGLAAHLLLGENDAIANYFSQRYVETMAQMAHSLPAEFEEIPLSYGGLSC